MLNLQQVAESMSADIEDTQKWAEDLYMKSFGNYLGDVRDLYLRLKDKARPISDDELEDILTTLPLKLIHIAEALSQFKISKEVVSITIKQKEAEFIESSEAKTITQKKEDAANAVLEYKLVQTVYATVISRVDTELDFTRELIMAAKKIWDSRKNTGNPVGMVVPEESQLPDYTGPQESSPVPKTGTYIR